MKSILQGCLIMFCIIVFGLQAEAQSLGFSRVLKVSAVADTVPSGKVWKLVNYLQARTRFSTNSQFSSCGSLTVQSAYWIDGEYFYDFGDYGGSSSTAGNGFPIWLPAGSFVRTTCPNDFLSIIEFNVVP